jgi:hypothetical protein
MVHHNQIEHFDYIHMMMMMTMMMMKKMRKVRGRRRRRRRRRRSDELVDGDSEYMKYMYVCMFL